MTAHRASLFLAAASASLLLPAAPATAQIADDVVLNILRECARIDDPTARLACFDNNIRSAGPRANVPVPGNAPAPQGGAAPLAGSRGGFGGESVRTPDRFETPVDEAQEVNLQVRRVTPREPGIYMLEMEDGAQWVFAESVGRDYRVPGAGDRVEIRRAAMDSFLLRFSGQVSVRVRRVR